MAIIKTSELKRKALDYAVADCLGFSTDVYQTIYIKNGMLVCKISENCPWLYWEPSENPAQAWPIIERERITLNSQQFDKQWIAYSHISKPVQIEYGETSLIAAMRCYVASVKGESVEIPDELIEV